LQGKHSIRWKQSDKTDLQRAVRNFNAKIDYIRKTRPELAEFQPEKKSYKDIKQGITTRNDLKRELKSLQRYSKRGSENVVKNKYGLAITKYEKKEIEYKVAKINRQRTKDRKKFGEMEVTTHGESTGLKRAEMGSQRMAQFNPKKFNFETQHGGMSWEKYVEVVEKQVKDSYSDELVDRYKENYLKGIENGLGEYGKELYKIVEQIPAQKVLETFYNEQEAYIDFHYHDYEPIDNDVKVDVLMDIWSNVLNDSHG
jgi:hypothetical protein